MRSQILCCVMVILLCSTTPVRADIDPLETPCVNTARHMGLACRVNVFKELNITLANCKNIHAREVRFECVRQAYRTSREEREGCVDQKDARLDVCDLLNEFRYDPDPLLDWRIDFIDPDEVGDIYSPNPYLNLEAGGTSVVRAGEDFEELVIIHVTDEVREINGVDCRVVVDAAFETEEDEEDGELEYVAVEITDDWYAQDINSNVYYCGELSRNFEDGVLRDLDGSFESGVEFAKAGVLIQAAPTPGDAHRQEFALDEAEDIVEYLDLATSPSSDEGGENPNFPCNNGCLKTLDSAPLEPESTEFKYYIPNVGFVLAVALEDGEITGEREELVCTGDSLDILEDDECGIEDPDELLEELCELSPEAFCG